jgi:hypothetical protein
MLHTNHWVESILEMSEGWLWKGAGLSGQEMVRRRDSILEGAVLSDKVSKNVLLAAFGLNTFSVSSTGEYDYKAWCYEAAKRTANELNLTPLVATASAARILTCMVDGIEKLVQDRRNLNQKQAQNDQEILAMREKLRTKSEELIARNKTITSHQTQKFESDMALQDLKYALKCTREELTAAKEEINRLKARQEKEGDAIFNSLNAKISERDTQLGKSSIYFLF